LDNAHASQGVQNCSHAVHIAFPGKHTSAQRPADENSLLVTLGS
jgi:hypothetical protein